MRQKGSLALVTGVACGIATVFACSGGSNSQLSWAGTIDTLPRGTVVTSNPETGAWTEGTAWQVVEKLRLGSVDESGPELFGNISAFEVDVLGRIYVFDGQANELRIFDAAGKHVRTVGREGGGPGEFKQVIGMAWGGDGNLWIVDPSNNRISVIDTSGTYVGSHWVIGNRVVYPWPGGVDTAGHFYTYAPDPTGEQFRDVLVRYAVDMDPLDTIALPHERSDQYFEYSRRDAAARASVPFGSRLIWRLASTGHIWFTRRGEYKLFQRALAGDTLRIISKEFEPIPVSMGEVDSALARLEWFTRQGGRIDRSKVPSTKPAIRSFLLDDKGAVWVSPMVKEAPRIGTRLFDIFDREGRYLGRVDLPFVLYGTPRPIVRNGMLYGVTRDELGVSFLVTAQVVRSGSDT